MVDTRFHRFAGPQSLAALLRAFGVVPVFGGEGPLIEGAEELDLAGPAHLALAAHSDYRDALRLTRAAAVIVSEDLAAEVPAGVLAIPHRNPHGLFVEVLDRLYPASTRGTVTALLGPHETLPLTETDVRLGPGVVLGPGVEV